MEHVEQIRRWTRLKGKTLIEKSNLIEIQRIETATYSNKAYFSGEHFLYF